FVDRETRKTVPISETVREVLENFLL
ncbi:acyl-CoA thioesterase, partial [Acinetobacter baumannii]